MIGARPHTPSEAIDAFLADPSLRPLLAAHRIIEARPPRYGPWPPGLDPRIVGALQGRRHRRSLYPPGGGDRDRPRRTQRVSSSRPPRRARRSATTCRSSRPSLRDPAARALYLFPTKALRPGPAGRAARADRGGSSVDLKTYTYDGDTPPRRPQRGPRGRAGRRHQPGHAPHRRSCRTTRSGSSCSRTCATSSSTSCTRTAASSAATSPTSCAGCCASALTTAPTRVFICCSATIANPRELAERLIEAPVELVDDNGAPAAGSKSSSSSTRRSSTEQLGIRGSALLDRPAPGRASSSATACRRSSSPASRTAVEVLTSYLRETFAPPPGHPQHGARLPRRLPAARAARDRARPARRRGARRRRDQRARAGHRHRRRSTPAMLRRLPGHHRRDLAADGPGRAARRHQPVGAPGRSSAPLDQFVAAAPGVPLRPARPEHGLVNPDNLHVLLTHLRARPSSCPFAAASAFGIEATADAARRSSTRTAYLRHAERRSLVLEPRELPGRAPSACAPAPPDNVVIIDTTGDRTPRSSARSTCFARAGARPRGGDLHPRGRRSTTSTGSTGTSTRPTSTRVDVDYYTDADLAVTLKVLEVFDEARADAGRRQHGEVMVAWQVTMFKKIKFHTHENVGWGPIDLPEQEMHTTAYWLRAAAELVNRYDRDTLDGALIGLARVARTTGAAAPDVRPARPRAWCRRSRRPSPASRRSTSTTPSRAGSASPSGCSTLTQSSSVPAAEAVDTCPCTDGCPACVGPAIEVGHRGKAVVASCSPHSTSRDRSSGRSPTRLAALRGRARPLPTLRLPTTAPRDLARWFGARLAAGRTTGARSSSSAACALPAGERRALASCPRGLLRHRDDRPVDRRRHRRRSWPALDASTAIGSSCASSSSPTTRTNARSCASGRRAGQPGGS